MTGTLQLVPGSIDRQIPVGVVVLVTSTSRDRDACTGARQRAHGSRGATLQRPLAGHK
jgi:hypothetical protein